MSFKKQRKKIILISRFDWYVCKGFFIKAFYFLKALLNGEGRIEKNPFVVSQFAERFDIELNLIHCQ